MAGDNAVIIKRIKKGGHAGHHGGAWKVAYADFVTAMMAFFLLMWLINTTTPEQKRGIADYFAAQSISQTFSGSGGVLGGKVLSEESSKAGGAVSVFQKSSPPAPSDTTHSKDKANNRGGSTAAEGSDPASQTQSSDHLERAVPSSRDGSIRKRRRIDPPGDARQPRAGRAFQAGDAGSDARRLAHPARRPGRATHVRNRYCRSHALRPSGS